MRKLLDGKFEPITWSIGFIEKPFPVVVDQYLVWVKQNHRAVECLPLEKPFAEALRSLEPLVPLGRKRLLVATASSWTAFFDNGINGSDPRTAVSYLAMILSCRGLVVTCVSNTKRSAYDKRAGAHGAVMFELLRIHPGNSSTTSVLYMR